MWLATTPPGVYGPCLRTLCVLFLMRARTEARSFGITSDLKSVLWEVPHFSDSTSSPSRSSSRATIDPAGSTPATLHGDPSLGGREGRYEWVSFEDLSADDTLCRREVESRGWTSLRFLDSKLSVWKSGMVNLSEMAAASAEDGTVRGVPSSEWRGSKQPMVLCYREFSLTPRYSRSLAQDDGILPDESAVEISTADPPTAGEQPEEAKSHEAKEMYAVVIVAVTGCLIVILFVVITVVVRLAEKRSMLVSGKARTRDIQCKF